MDGQLADWLRPHRRLRALEAGAILLRAGDPANEILLIRRGTVRVGKQAQVFGPGKLLGAIGVFSPGRRVVRSVVAAMAGELYFLDADSARRLHRGNPVLASYLIGLVADRLLERARLKPRLASARKRAAAGPRA